MKKINIVLAGVIGMMAMTLSVSAAPVTCKTIAEIKAQADKTEIEYTGTATTTFYNGKYSGLFIQDETGGIMLKGFNMPNKATDHVTDSMKISNIIAKFNTTKSAQNITVATANKESITIVERNVAFVPEILTMSEFCKNAQAYDSKAIIVKDANITTVAVSKYSKKCYMIAGTDTVEFNTSNISPKGPNGGDMAGSYTSYNNRFMLSSAEHTKVTSFAGFSECLSYFNYVTAKEDESYKIDDPVLVNYVSNQGGETVIFAQYANNQIVNGVTVRVKGKAEINVGDSINGLEGVYVHATKDKTDTKKFKGSVFTQTAGKAVTVVNSNNKLTPKSDINIGDLLTSKLSENYSNQIIVSKHEGTLAKTGDKYTYTISYEQSSGLTEGADKTETVTHTINVVGDNSLDLSQYLGGGVILSGVYDPCVVNSEPTIIVRDKNDILKNHYAFASISELINHGEPTSESVTYELTNEVQVNYVKTQQQKGIAQTWAFVSDATGVLAIDFGTKEMTLEAKQKIKGLKGSYDDGVDNFGRQISAPNMKVDEKATITTTGTVEALEYLKATLQEIMTDKAKYASRLVELTEVYSGQSEISDASGNRTDYYIYQKDENGDKTAEMHYDETLHITQTMNAKNTIRGLVNMNCLSGAYVIYATEVINEPISQTAVENNEIERANIYVDGSSLLIEAEEGTEIEIYDMQGRSLYAEKSVSEITRIDNLKDIVIVRIGEKTYKALIK